MSDDASFKPEMSANLFVDVVLTPDEASKYTDFINRKAADPTDPCPLCHSPLNYVSEYVFRVETIKEPAALGGRAMPLFLTVCGNCSFVRFFNRLTADAIIHAEAKASPELPFSEISTVSDVGK